VVEAYLEIRDAAGRNGVFPLNGDTVTVGRRTDNALALSADDTVSGRHALLEHAAEGWTIRDTGSSNGTSVNGTRLQGGHSLIPGDEIAVGHTVLTFRSGHENVPLSSTTSLPSASSYLDTGEEWSPGAPPEPAPRSRSMGQPAPPPQIPRALPAVQPRQPSRPVQAGEARGGSGSVRGIARAVATRRGENDRSLLAFRVDRYDDSGNRLPAVSVELRDHRQGAVNEGEEVEVTGTYKRGTLVAKRIVNLSTNAEIRGAGRGQNIALGIAYTLVIGFILIIVVAIVLG
jgi:pSer/pThr/pTyr-binding forkhead associated (FHA) protein